MLRMHRDTLSPLGPVLPVAAFPGRLPTVLCRLATLLLTAGTSGSLTTTGLAGGALAGATVPQVGPLARTRSVPPARRSGADDRRVGTLLSCEETLDEVSLVLGPALVGSPRRSLIRPPRRWSWPRFCR
ncbi:hypothetical protein [Streptomyces sp. QHH-9511]|uniref:hypothetical protein n=1 Tax=Streptomyces sp. QHH-9511 TaxID=2684468 RepID=UPI0018E0A22C|nr:hypothetical protein [Streptomyces sp. QHH-9511]